MNFLIFQRYVKPLSCIVTILSKYFEKVHWNRLHCTLILEIRQLIRPTKRKLWEMLETLFKLVQNSVRLSINKTTKIRMPPVSYWLPHLGVTYKFALYENKCSVKYLWGWVSSLCIVKSAMRLLKIVRCKVTEHCLYNSSPGKDN